MASTHSATPQVSLHAEPFVLQRWAAWLLMAMALHGTVVILFGWVLGQRAVAWALTLPAVCVQVVVVVACAGLCLLARRPAAQAVAAQPLADQPLADQALVEGAAPQVAAGVHHDALLARAEQLEGALQALQQANLDRTRLFAQISHEVRNPLNGLLGFAQLMRQSPLSEQQRSHLEQISLCGTTIHKIVSDMLDFSRLEAQPAALDARPFRPSEVVAEAVAMLSSVAQQKGLAIVLEGQPPAKAVGDALRVQQVLLNLLGNALKFTQQGQVTVRCQAVPGAGGHGVLRIEVEDSGIGIPAEALPRLFQPFCPVSQHTIGRYGGTGLGLAICKRLVDAMHGEIGVHSQLGQGSCFWFEVPLTVQPLQQVA